MELYKVLGFRYVKSKRANKIQSNRGFIDGFKEISIDRQTVMGHD